MNWCSEHISITHADFWMVLFPLSPVYFLFPFLKGCKEAYL